MFDNLFPQQDPDLAVMVPPGAADYARNAALAQLGLGIMAAPYSGRGTAAGLAGALQGATGTYQDAMDSAFRHTLLKHQIENQNADREFLQQERKMQLEQQARQQQEGAAQTGQRLLTGYEAAGDKGGDYLNLVGNSPEVRAALQNLGVTAPEQGATPEQLQDFVSHLRAASSVSAPAAAPMIVPQGAAVTQNGKVVFQNAPKRTVEWKDKGSVLEPHFSDTGELVPGLKPIQKDLTPDQARAGNNFSDEQGSLLASLAIRGVSLPAGLRSKQQQIATLQGIIDRNPGKSPDELADLVASGQIGFASEKKATQAAAGIAGKVGYAENEIQQTAPLALRASAAVPRSNFVPLAKLEQMGEKNVNDPALRQFMVYNQSLINAYEMLAARSGTDMKKREHIEGLLRTADTPESYAAAVAAIQGEAEASRKAGEQAARLKPGSTLGAGGEGATPVQPSAFATPEAAALAAQQGKIKKGDRITVNGVSGTWQ